MKKTITAVKGSPLFLLAALLLVPSLAHAHTGVGTVHGFTHGFAHPLGGLDHLCAMIAVGIWAAQLGGRAIWAVPATFVGVMALGGALGVAQIPLPFVEQGIVASVLMLGVFIAAAVRMPLWASIVMVGLFATCHGFAHGAEMPSAASGLTYGAGFMIATAFLHVVGIGFGVAIQKLARPDFVRLTGAAIILCGAYLLIG